MVVDALYKDRDGRVKILEAEVRRQEAEMRRQAEAYGEEHAVCKMLEQQYASLKKKVESQVLGSLPFMNVLRSDVPSASLGSIACPPPSAKSGRQEEGGSGVPPRDNDGGAEGGGES